MPAEVRVACCNLPWHGSVALLWRAQRGNLLKAMLGTALLAGALTWFAEGPTVAAVAAVTAIPLAAVLYSSWLVYLFICMSRVSRRQRPYWVISAEQLARHVASGAFAVIPWTEVKKVTPDRWGYRLRFRGGGEHVLAYRSFATPEQRALFENYSEQSRQTRREPLGTSR